MRRAIPAVALALAAGASAFGSGAGGPGANSWYQVGAMALFGTLITGNDAA